MKSGVALLGGMVLALGTLADEIVWRDSFDSAEKSQWLPAHGFSVRAGEGLNGGNALVWEESVIRPAEAAKPVAATDDGNAVRIAAPIGGADCSRFFPVEAGRRYFLSAKVKGAITNNCAYLFFRWFDKSGKMLGRAEAQPTIYKEVGKKGWEELKTSSQRLPSDAVRGEVYIQVYRTTLGKMAFDDVTLSCDDFKPVVSMFSSAYRDAAERGKVRFVVPYAASRARYPMSGLKGVFTFVGPQGPFDVAADAVLADRFEVMVDVSRLKTGTQEVRAALSCDGRTLGTCAMDFVRLAEPPRQRVRFDERGRTLVDGKPFLPLGVYVHPRDHEVRYLDRLKGGPFNCVIETTFSRAMLDKFYDIGLMVLPRSPWKPQDIRSVYGDLRTHPALLAWYVIDEAPPSRAEEEIALQKIRAEADPDHPTFGVFDYPRNVDAFMGSCDVIAPDPYPIGYRRYPISIAADYPVKCRERSYALRPLWQVPQAFAWDWCHKHGHPNEDRYPTYAELRAMAWMAIAGGANGLLWYSAHHIFKCEKPEKLEESWGNLVKVAKEIRRHEALILSDEEAPQAVSMSTNIAVRAFCKDGKVWVLAVNKTTEPVTGKVSVEGFGEVSFELPGLGIKTHRFNSVNYDETKVGAYTLEDPLLFADGTPLKSAADWPKRRAEILDIFAREMYGQEPPRPEEVVTETFEKGETLAGLALREQVRMWFRSDKSGPSMDWLIVRPKYAKGPVPVIVQLNYYGNHDFLTDPEVVLPRGWMQNEALSGGFAITNHRACESMRGRLCRTDQRYAFPINTMIARGYAFMTACYADVSPDPDYLVDDMEDLPYTGVFSLWGKRDPSRTDNVTALGAWAWALSRGLDLAAQHPDLDAKRSLVTGCSRLGKAALLAAARDERFAVCVPNQTGNGGVPLAKRNFGENVFREIEMFPHWFCQAYQKYIDNEKAMTFDQHLLLASIAPRHLLVQGFDRPWFDPKGEWLSCKAASSAWTFLGKPGLPDVAEPECFSTAAIGSCLGYVRRKGQHGIAGCDWQWMMDFADKAFNR